MASPVTEVRFGESDGCADSWEARGAGIRTSRFSLGDKVVMLPENQKPGEAGLGESHLEDFFFFFWSKMSLLCPHF